MGNRSKHTYVLLGVANLGANGGMVEVTRDHNPVVIHERLDRLPKERILNGISVKVRSKIVRKRIRRGSPK